MVLTVDRRSTSRRYVSLLVGYATLKSPNNDETGLVFLCDYSIIYIYKNKKGHFCSSLCGVSMCVVVHLSYLYKFYKTDFINIY